MKKYHSLAKRIFSKLSYPDKYQHIREVYDRLLNYAKEKGDPTEFDPYDIYLEIGGDDYIIEKYKFFPPRNLQSKDAKALYIISLVICAVVALIYPAVFGVFNLIGTSWSGDVYYNHTILGVNLDGSIWIFYFRVYRILLVIVASILLIIISREGNEKLTKTLTLGAGFMAGLWGSLLILSGIINFFNGKRQLRKLGIILSVSGLALYAIPQIYISLNISKISFHDFAAEYNNEISKDMKVRMLLDDLDAETSNLIDLNEEDSNILYMNIRDDAVHRIEIINPVIDFSTYEGVFQDNSVIYVSFLINDIPICDDLEYKATESNQGAIPTGGVNNTGYYSCDNSNRAFNPFTIREELFDSWILEMKLDYTTKDNLEISETLHLKTIEDPFQYIISQRYNLSEVWDQETDAYGSLGEIALFSRGQYISYIEFSKTDLTFPSDLEIKDSSNVKFTIEINNTILDDCSLVIPIEDLLDHSSMENLTCRLPYENSVYIGESYNEESIQLLLHVEYLDNSDEETVYIFQYGVWDELNQYMWVIF